MTTTDNSVSWDLSEALVRSDLPLPDRRQGKVRDLYTVPRQGPSPGGILIIATDRISAFDVVMPTPIPGKGRVLTEISVQWFEFFRPRGHIADHLITTVPAEVPGLEEQHRAQIAGRMMLGRAAEVIPVEFVVRGYLAGSGWKEYQLRQSVCGVALPAGLTQCQQLPAPIFTPTTKANSGHDEAITFERACETVDTDVMNRLRDVSLTLYSEAAAHAQSRGIILADTKFEFGYALDERGNRTDEILLIDEIFTPDSSRFWPLDEYEAGRDQDSFDKQYVRNYLQGLVDEGRWDKQPPGPELPPDIQANTIAKYVEARDRLFGSG